MFAFDLTETRLFDAASGEDWPAEGELFVITVALLLIRDVGPSDLSDREVRIEREDIPALAECIRSRLPSFLREYKNAESMSLRLEDFVGLRIAAIRRSGQCCTRRQT